MASTSEPMRPLKRSTMPLVCVDAGLGRRLSPPALRMRQMLSRLRCAHEMGDDKRQVIEREVGDATQRADNGALLLDCLQSNWCGRAEWSRRNCSPPAWNS